MIIWYISILYFVEEGSNLLVVFERFEETNTWPNRAKLNFQFYYKGEVCCVLPVEYSPETLIEEIW